MPYPLHLGFFLIIINLLIFPFSALAQSDCGAPELSADQIHEIIKRERGNRNDLPRAYPKYEYKVNKKGCYYDYFEIGLPYKPEYSKSFMVNRFGTIVEARVGNGMPVNIKCTEKVYSEDELAEIIKKERKLRQDLPPPFANYKVQVERYGCLYWYLEWELPEGSKNYLAFQIDPFGELMNSSLHKLTGQ
jgi:hypothetical protein